MRPISGEFPNMKAFHRREVKTSGTGRSSGEKIFREG
jgi:hypothetical protein